MSACNRIVVEIYGFMHGLRTFQEESAHCAIANGGLRIENNSRLENKSRDIEGS